MPLKDPVARKAYQKVYKAKYKQRYHEHNLLWRAKNKDRVKQIAHECYMRNREKRLATAKAWRDKNKLVIKISHELYVPIHQARAMLGEGQ